MKRNQKLAKELNRPSCQDTGVLQFWVKCGVDFPLIGEVEGSWCGSSCRKSRQHYAISRCATARRICRL
ncbi:fumarate hydratase [Faecalibacterium sp. DFI.5.82]|uniref:fumarate hydratase n=1 Tax=Faecalibacterium sp. DFI.5.82 TaxID=3031725 RepID=UPI003183123A